MKILNIHINHSRCSEKREFIVSGLVLRREENAKCRLCFQEFDVKGKL